jgi:hypothetical protein
MARVAFKASMGGEKEMRAKLRQIAGDQGMRKEARRAMSAVAPDHVEIMRGYTPEKTGRLKRSERFRVMVSQKKEDLRISFLAGGAEYNILYAHKVHEDLAAKHPKGGQAKFMERMMAEAAQTIAAEIGAELKLEDTLR